MPIGGITLLITMFLFSNPKPSDTSIPFNQKLVELYPISNVLFIPALTSLFITLGLIPSSPGIVARSLVPSLLSSPLLLPFHTTNIDGVTLLLCRLVS